MGLQALRLQMQNQQRSAIDSGTTHDVGLIPQDRYLHQNTCLHIALGYCRRPFHPTWTTMFHYQTKHPSYPCLSAMFHSLKPPPGAEMEERSPGLGRPTSKRCPFYLGRIECDQDWRSRGQHARLLCDTVRGLGHPRRVVVKCTIRIATEWMTRVGFELERFVKEPTTLGRETKRTCGGEEWDIVEGLQSVVLDIVQIRKPLGSCTA